MGAALLAMAAVGGFAWLRLVHDPEIRSEYQARLDVQVAAARLADAQRAQQVVASMEEMHRAQLAAAVTTRERIIRVPVTTGCIARPAIAAALDGLRAPPSPPGAPGGAPGAARVPGGTGAAPASR